MSHAKQAFKRKSWTKAVTVGVAGVLSLAGASVTSIGPAGDASTEGECTGITLGEEEFSDVSRATRRHPSLQLIRERRHRGRSGTGRAVYGGSAIYGGGGDYGGGGAPTGAGGPDGL